MEQKVEQFILKGMQRDTSISKVSNEFSFENMNIRITARDNNTLLSVTNEKGNSELTNLKPNLLKIQIQGSDTWKIVAEMEVTSDVTGTVLFSDVDGNPDEYASWTIYKGAKESGESTVKNDSIGNLHILSNKKDDTYIYVVSEKERLENTITTEVIGECIGYATINKYLILFTKDQNTDYILKADFTDKLNITTLYSGNLGFELDHPIETLALYENEDVQKVYWVDGKNQPRMINVIASEETIEHWKNIESPFDVVPTLRLQEEIEIVRNPIANGVFAPGVIQYIFTYFNKYGQESNPFYTSPLYYTSFNDRGGSPEDKVSNSFNITIKNADSNFDYVRIYSLLRTSIDGTPITKKVADLPINTNLLGYSLDLKDAEYVGSFVLLPTQMGGASLVSQIKLCKINDEGEVLEDSLDSIIEAVIDEGSTDVLMRTYKIADYPEYPIIKIRGTYYKNVHTITLNGGNIETGIWNYGSIGFYNYFDEYKDSNVLKSVGFESTELKVIPLYEINYTDTGTTGETIDPTELLYLGGEAITAETIAQKDNTLFFGNLKLLKDEISKTLRDKIHNLNIEFKYDLPILLPKLSGYYQYKNNLEFNSIINKTFKSREWYRFGLQFQHKTGKWSEPIWVNDLKNNLFPNTDSVESREVKLPIASTTLESDIISDILSKDFIKIRPVVVYPTFSDREAICQGILCPTVYNMQDRLNNAPFVQSSWFVRPNSTSYNPTKELYEISDSIFSPLFFKTDEGRVPEFRHNKYLPSSLWRNAEIQNIYEPVSAYIDTNKYNSTESISEYVTQHSENFYVDQSILTLHSPDIEFDDNVQNLDTSGLNMRIVGVVPLTSYYGDIDIQTSTPQLMLKESNAMPLGFYHKPSGFSHNEGINYLDGKLALSYGDRCLISGFFWMDSIYKSLNKDLYIGYAIYPWHRNGSLNNQRFAEDNTRSAMLQYKKLSNLKVSYNSIYSEEIPISPTTDKSVIVEDLKIFNSNEVVATKLKYHNKDILYYGNIDTVLTFNSYNSTPENTPNIDGVDGEYNRNFGYPIITSSVYTNITTESADGFLQPAYSGYYKIFNDPYKFSYVGDKKLVDNYGNLKGWTSTDPIRMKYKSSPHAVLSLPRKDSYTQYILPVMDHYGEPEASNTEDQLAGGAFWDTLLNSVEYNKIYADDFHLKIFESNDIIDAYGFLYLGELYNPNVVNRFGGQTQEAFENNKWLPCGEAVSLYDNGTLKQSVEVKWTEGDTYYQRYDHVKTYPFTLEDQNSISEVVSFMCETRINLDGRYDKNRGNLTNFVISPENFNKINDVYNQENNFFVYRALNYDKFSLDKFPNSITWTKEKQLGELVDTWTNITMASTLDLDGEKGEIASLNTFNNEVFAFQKHGISHILFNSRVQIPTSDGVPIEITNGLKVDGKRYLSEVGTHNKWSIATTPNGIYFIDNITNGIYLFTGESLEPLSEKLGFSQWVGENGSMDKWNNEYKNFRTFYDKVNGDVYFTTKDTSLCFSETLGQFTSFMNYENLPAMFNIDNKFYSIKNNKIWEQNAGDYNMFYGEYKPYYVTYRVNPQPYSDKIFTNIDFRSDTFDGDILTHTTFNKLKVWNEYQYGESNLEFIKGITSNLKRKFRMWRANIPRDVNNKRDRIRNPWTYIQLLKDKEDTLRTEFHDLIVYYFE